MLNEAVPTPAAPQPAAFLPSTASMARMVWLDSEGNSGESSSLLSSSRSASDKSCYDSSSSGELRPASGSSALKNCSNCDGFIDAE
eukprot:1256510-Pleurochrysis_carterae.AAC.1